MNTRTRPGKQIRGAGEAAGSERSAAPGPASVQSPTYAVVPVPATVAAGGEETVTPEDLRQDEVVVERVEHLAKDVGWVLVAAGVVGLIMPGVLGTPFLIAGAAALWPGNRKRFQHWREGRSPKFFHGSMKQINRFLDDLERRYPKRGPR